MNIRSLLQSRGRLVLDGGLATSCEALGANLSGALWSARLLRDEPALLEKAHAQFTEAGADVCITASYQAHHSSLQTHLGTDSAQATRLIASSVTIARAAAASCAAAAEGRPTAVAGSIGPYGACLADGSEYTGAYSSMPAAELADWHRHRFEALVDAGSDFLAMETIPCRSEVVAMCSLLRTRPEATAWLSLVCSSGEHITSGERVVDCVADIERLDTAGQIDAVGVNCTSPRHVSALIRTIREATDRPIVVYPNSGEQWDSAAGMWRDGTSMGPADFADLATSWYAEGAALVGGCCRVGPDFIAAVRAVVDRS